MNIQKEFLELESKFALLDTKLNNKRLLVNNLHDCDTNKINNLYNTDLENGISASILNEYRGKLLNTIKETVDFDINEVNQLANYLSSCLTDLNRYNPQQRARKINTSSSLLEFRHKEIKEHYLSLTKTHYTNSDLNRYKYKLTRPLSLENLSRFKHLLKNGKLYNIELPESVNELDEDFTLNCSVHILPANKILLGVMDLEGFFNMFIINKEGAIQYSNQNEIDIFSDYKICVSKSKIALSYEIRNEEESLAEAELGKTLVYDFKLNLILSFNLEVTEYSIYSLMHNDELALRNMPVNDKVKVFNLINLNSKEFKFQMKNPNEKFHVDDFNDDLIHFDDKCFYFKSVSNEDDSSIVYFVNRSNGLRVIDIKLDPNITPFINKFFISNFIDLNCLEYDADKGTYKIQRDLFKNFDSILNDNEESFLGFSQFDSMIYNLIKTQRFVSFEEY